MTNNRRTREERAKNTIVASGRASEDRSSRAVERAKTDPIRSQASERASARENDCERAAEPPTEVRGIVRAEVDAAHDAVEINDEDQQKHCARGVGGAMSSKGAALSLSKGPALSQCAQRLLTSVVARARGARQGPRAESVRASSSRRRAGARRAHALIGATALMPARKPSSTYRSSGI